MLLKKGKVILFARERESQEVTKRYLNHGERRVKNNKYKNVSSHRGEDVTVTSRNKHKKVRRGAKITLRQNMTTRVSNRNGAGGSVMYSIRF